MSYNITLSSSMRSNLLSLRNIATQMSKTQNILSTGKKVNNAIDNASSYYQARSLTHRAADLNSLLDNMGQCIQTIQVATQGIETGLSLFEQMKSIANEATVVLNDDLKKINSSMSTLQIQQILNEGGIISLEDDIILTDGLSVNVSGTTIVGNGHSITYEGSYGFSDILANRELVNKIGDSAIRVLADAKISGLNINYSNTADQGAAITIAGARADIDNITISGTSQSDRMYGIQVIDQGELQLDTTKGINIDAKYGEKLVNGNPNIWSGKYNTDKIVEQMGADNIAAYATKNFAPTASLQNDEIFGQGNWYLPSQGEAMDMYGYDYGSNIATGYNKSIINQSMSTLYAKKCEAENINGWYWTSTETGNAGSMSMGMGAGIYSISNKPTSNLVRASLFLENCFVSPPLIGDVVYSDMSYGKASEYDAKKTAVGVVYWVSEDGASAKIVSLKNLSVSVNSETGWQEFDVNNPYGASTSIKFQNTAYKDEQGKYFGTDITGINNYNLNLSVSNIASLRGNITVTNESVAAMNLSETKYCEQFNLMLKEYDNIIQDSSFQGVNLLQGDSLKTIFNETRTHDYIIKGYDIKFSALGVKEVYWEVLSDVNQSVIQLQKATTNLRSMSERLGNDLSIIQTRQNFTKSLSDVLETGADDLVLADMNEASAEYLMLQTRQQLAVNSLSLASQSARSVLSLF